MDSEYGIQNTLIYPTGIGERQVRIALCDPDRGCLKCRSNPSIRIQEHPNGFIWEHEIYEKMKDRLMMQTGTFMQFDGEYEKVNYLTFIDLNLTVMTPLSSFQIGLNFQDSGEAREIFNLISQKSMVRRTNKSTGHGLVVKPVNPGQNHSSRPKMMKQSTLPNPKRTPAGNPMLIKSFSIDRGTGFTSTSEVLVRLVKYSV